jgi:hypothetical protein
VASLQQAKVWLKQAKADLLAALGAPAKPECHRRYWLQQAYEKALKSLALIMYSGQPSDPEFLTHFLNHSPLEALEQANKLSKRMHSLARQVQRFINLRREAARLRKIDATRPSNKDDQVSYRYPFRVGSELIAPADYDDWDSYQGEWLGVTSAVSNFIVAVSNELITQARKPS